MRLSISLTILWAVLALASPILKRSLVTEIVTTVVYEYVTIDVAAQTSFSVLPTTTIMAIPDIVPTSITAPSPPSLPTPSPLPPSLLATAPPSPPPSTATDEAPPSAEPTQDLETAASATLSPSPSTAVDPNAGLPTGTDYPSTVVYHHNIHRRNHSSPDATWDTTMASYAAQVADSCHYGHDLSPGNGGYGQNIAAASQPGHPEFNASHMGASAITDLWYNSELSDFLPSYYGQANPDNFESWGHFSQIVWAGSTGVGCASTLCDGGQIFGTPTWFTVCNYSPPGNMGGAYGENIGLPLGHATETVI